MNSEQIGLPWVHRLGTTSAGAHVAVIGPLELEHLSAKDDPRNDNS